MWRRSRGRRPEICAWLGSRQDHRDSSPCLERPSRPRPRPRRSRRRRGRWPARPPATAAAPRLGAAVAAGGRGAGDDGAVGGCAAVSRTRAAAEVRLHRATPRLTCLRSRPLATFPCPGAR
jgi:hypothetical protein